MRKKLLTFIALAAVIILLMPVSSRAVAADAAVYAYLPADTAMYSATGDGYEVRVYLPKTYFVTILSTNGYYHRVSYGDLTGYVRTASVDIVGFEPVTKVAYGEASLKSGIASVYMYDDAALTIIAATVSPADALIVYGGINSAESSYYCRLAAFGVYRYGYLPAVGVNVTLPPENDVRAVEPPPDDTPVIAPPGDEDSNEVTLQIILIVSLVIPSVVVVTLIFSDKKKPKRL